LRKFAASRVLVRERCVPGKRPDQEWKVRETVLSKVRNRRSITSKKGSKSAGRVDLTGNLSSTKDVLLVMRWVVYTGAFHKYLKVYLCH